MMEDATVDEVDDALADVEIEARHAPRAAFGLAAGLLPRLRASTVDQTRAFRLLASPRTPRGSSACVR